MEGDNIPESTSGSLEHISPMGKKVIELLSQINENLSPELKESLKNMMQGYNELSEDEKKSFEETVKKKLGSQILVNRFWSAATGSALVGICIAAVLFIFVFFGYKLYKSLKEKERKRDEKKKLRQQKKKK